MKALQIMIQKILKEEKQFKEKIKVVGVMGGLSIRQLVKNYASYR